MPKLPDMTQLTPPAETGQKIVLDETAPNIAVFSTTDGAVRVEARLQGDTVWLSQKLMAQLYGVSVPNIAQHLKAIFADGELMESSVIKEYLITATDGKNYRTKFYNLDAIIHVGYRVRSSVGGLFRAWATERLKEYMIKGFTMDDDRLKYGDGYDHHFEELLARIRDIRSSEKIFYRKVRELISSSSVDYALRKNEAAVHDFFANLQNCLLYAVCGHTAAEIKCFRADAAKPHMGLTSFRGEVVRIADIDIAKNYLAEDELTKLNQLVTMFLDFAALRASNHQDMTLEDWMTQTGQFLTFNEQPVLKGYGTRRCEQGNAFVRQQYAVYQEKLRQEALAAADREDALDGERLNTLEQGAGE